MTDLRKAAEDLLEVVEAAIKAGDWKVDGACDLDLAIVRLRQALAQPKQEPVLWMMPDGKNVDKWGLQFYGGVIGKPLYTAPPKRKWVGLTDEDRSDLLTQHHGWNEFGIAIEAKLKEKNT